MDFKNILYNQEDSVVRITLNRPDTANALSLELIEEIITVIEGLEKSQDVSVLVIDSSGKNFSSGHLLKELVDGSMLSYRNVFTRCSEMMEKLHRLAIPVLASVRGAAFAAGCQLVGACDLAVAEESARFATPGVKIGLFCTTPMVSLTRCVGRKTALDMLITGRVLSAPEALQHGLISRICTAERLEEETNEIARTIATYSRVAVRSGKAAFYHQIEMAETEAIFYAKDVISYDLAYEDAREGIRAFIEKREPVWKHQ